MKKNLIWFTFLLGSAGCCTAKKTTEYKNAHTAEWVEILERFVADPDPDTWRFAVVPWPTSEEAKAGAAAALGEILTDYPDPPHQTSRIRFAAARILYALPKWIPKEPALPYLVKALDDQDKAIRVSAVKELNNIGPPAHPALLVALGNKDQDVQLLASFYLGIYADEVDFPAEDILARLEQASSTFRRELFTMYVGGQDGVGYEHLTEAGIRPAVVLLEDEDSRIRLAAVQTLEASALAAVKTPEASALVARTALASLTKIAKNDENEEVRVAAAAAIEKIRVELRRRRESEHTKPESSGS